MKFIEEVVVEEFLPTVRSMLAEDLRERGLTQSEVAAMLGISQSAVSKYAHGEVARNEVVLGDERVTDLVSRVGEGLSTGDMSRVQALIEAEVLIRRLETRGDLLATLHEESMPELADHEGEFRIHDPESELRTTERVLSSVRRGLRTLENASGFAGLIPNVGSNLVECSPDAVTIDDVAGVPGRIFDVKGRATIPGDPEFGVSEHVANVLLTAREHGSEASAALNVRYDPSLSALLSENGHTVVEFEGEKDLDEAIAAALDSEPDATVLAQTGGFGIEPVIYVLGEDAPAVAEAIKPLLR
ncbi:thiamine-phosphate synthase family protein [Halalkalicoccus jeotgali]|uniref:Phosphomethylpyrimidine kinase n=1 Tax=Halalkalicoccus jeotgali (strain DSM 18796 / CECT 7217 / JCM 14584 / KCTC 4019 / B3) TaxID=795797 RepID=D8J718_HALJB|nr:thiamine-phosphate synthase family protein [Halalkalicoccus jeotgali]ADJ15971.1 Phosphomethylpyrimidine kinase [Halalkalicoccus jeotgali B3]ELY38067.1 phosphomethylpyrimidine kinase [Halalkalicoccus jeotgali B3]